MSGLNISDYLSHTTGRSISNDNNVSALFNSLNGDSTTNSILSANTQNNSNMLGISFTDYSQLKSGSYYKLMKKYYSDDTKVSKEDLDAYQKKQDITASKAASASSAINDLLDMSYTEENRSKITDKIQKFVDEYNSMLKNATSSTSPSIKQKAEWMTNMVKEFDNALQSVGLSAGASGELSINSETLSKADINAIKNAFGANANSFSNKVLYKTEQIYSLAKTYGSSATAYTSSGTYNRDYSANYDTTT